MRNHRLQSRPTENSAPRSFFGKVDQLESRIESPVTAGLVAKLLQELGLEDIER